MKKALILLLAAFALTSCTMGTFGCPTYGELNKATHHGKKTQAHHARKHSGRV